MENSEFSDDQGGRRNPISDAGNNNAEPKSPRDYEAERRDFCAKRFQYWVLALIVLAIVAALPSIGERWAYSTQKGVERAKYEAAKQFLSERPEAANRARIPYVVKLAGPSVVGIKTNTYSRGFFGDTSISGWSSTRRG